MFKCENKCAPGRRWVYARRRCLRSSFLVAVLVAGGLSGCDVSAPVGLPSLARKADRQAEASARASSRQVAVTFQDQRVWASVPGTIQAAGVTGCELVEMVVIGQLGMSASCSNLAGSFSLASWYPDPLRLLRLVTHTLEAGGAKVLVREGGLVVTGTGDETGAVGTTADRRETDSGDTFIEGVGAVSVDLSSDLMAKARSLVGSAADSAVILRHPLEDVLGVIDLGRLSATASAVGERSAVRGAPEEIQLIRDLLEGEYWTAHALQGMSGGEVSARWLEDGFTVEVVEVAGRVIVRGHPDQVVAAVGALRSMGLVRRPRVVDLAFVYASQSRLQDLGVSLDAQVGGGSYVVRAGEAVSPGLTAVLSQIDGRSGVQIAERPSLSVTDGLVAKIQVGTDVPVQVSSDEDGQSFEYRSTGTLVSVLTEPGLSNLVKLTVSVEVSTVDGEGVGGNPVVATRTFSATMEVETGRASVIAALVSDGSSRSSNKSFLTGFDRSSQSSESVLNLVVSIR